MRRSIFLLAFGLSIRCGLLWPESSECQFGAPDCDLLGTALLYGLQGRFVLAGDAGQIYASENGLNWQNASVGGANLNAVAYGPPGFVAVGIAGTIWHSRDGRPGTWLSTPSGTADPLNGVAYGPAGFVAVGGVAPAPRVLHSSNGMQWQDVTPAASSAFLQAAYLPLDGGQYVATGLAGVRAISADGRNWTVLPVASDNLQGGIAYGNGRVVCGSDSGAIFSGRSVAELSVTGSVSGAVTTGITFWRGEFRMGSDGGELYRSIDGIGAATQMVSPTSNARDITIGNSELLLSSGGAHEIVWSADGIQWNGPLIPAGALGAQRGAAFVYLPAIWPRLP